MFTALKNQKIPQNMASSGVFIAYLAIKSIAKATSITALAAAVLMSAAHAQTATFRALQQHNADQKQGKNKVDGKNDVFHEASQS